MEKNIEHFWDDFGRAFSSKLSPSKKLGKPLEVKDRMVVADFVKTQLNNLMASVAHTKNEASIEIIEKEIVTLERMEKRLLSGDIDEFALKSFIKSVDTVDLAVAETSLGEVEKRNISLSIHKMKKEMDEKFGENLKLMGTAKELFQKIAKKIERVSKGEEVSQEDLAIATAAMIFIIRHHPHMSSSAEEIRDDKDNVIKYELLASNSLFQNDPILTSALGLNKEKFINMLNHSELGHVNIEYSLAHVKNYLSSDLFKKSKIPVSVNIAEMELRNTEYLNELSKLSTEHLEDGEYLGKYIQFELLESSIKFAEKVVADGLMNLKEDKQCHIGMDDFGSKHSNFGRLNELRALQRHRGYEKEIVSFIKFDQRIISLNTINEIFAQKFVDIKQANDGVSKHFQNILTIGDYSVEQKIVKEVVSAFITKKGLDGLEGGYEECMRDIAVRLNASESELKDFFEDEEFDAILTMHTVISENRDKTYIAEHVDLQAVRDKVSLVAKTYGAEMLVQGFMFPATNIPHKTSKATEEEINVFFEIVKNSSTLKKTKEEVFNANKI